MSLEQYKYANRKGLREILQIQVERIAELEKRLSHAETMSDKEQSIRDLEQQAKGVNEFANKFCGDCKTLEQASVSYCADSFIKSLKEQPKNKL
jgi:hypothetical protein